MGAKRHLKFDFDIDSLHSPLSGSSGGPKEGNLKGDILNKGDGHLKNQVLLWNFYARSQLGALLKVIPQESDV